MTADVSLTLIETTGGEALAKWRDLKSAGRGSPVILGGGYAGLSFDDLLTSFGLGRPPAPSRPSVEDILRAAAEIRFPDDLAKRFDAMALESRGPPIGEWPASPNPSMGLSVVRDILSQELLAKVTIAVAPTDDWTTIPAYLRWGGWNDCPAPEYHVAAMRAWRDRHGAELVGVTSDVINVRVASRPQTRKEALSLARDHYVYCPDLIDQGVETYSALAADLMTNNWWNFWWD